MMLSAQNILQAFNTMPEDQQQKILDTIQQENRIRNKNSAGETTRTRKRPVRTCTQTYKQRGCVQYMTSDYSIQTESIGELGYKNTLPMFLSRNFTTGFKSVKWEQTNEIGAVCVLPEEYDGKPNHCLFSDRKRTYVVMFLRSVIFIYKNCYIYTPFFCCETRDWNFSQVHIYSSNMFPLLCLYKIGLRI